MCCVLLSVCRSETRSSLSPSLSLSLSLPPLLFLLLLLFFFLFFLIGSLRACFVPRYTADTMEMLRVTSLEDIQSLPATKWNVKQPEGMLSLTRRRGEAKIGFPRSGSIFINNSFTKKLCVKLLTFSILSVLLHRLFSSSFALLADPESRENALQTGGLDLIILPGLAFSAVM